MKPRAWDGIAPWPHGDRIAYDPYPPSKQRAVYRSVSRGASGLRQPRKRTEKHPPGGADVNFKIALRLYAFYWKFNTYRYE